MSEQAIWYYLDHGEQRGPISIDELKRRAAAGRFTPEDLVWREGLAEWTAAKHVPELVGGSAQPQPMGASPTLPSPGMSGAPAYDTAPGQPVYHDYAPPGQPYQPQRSRAKMLAALLWAAFAMQVVTALLDLYATRTIPNWSSPDGYIPDDKMPLVMLIGVVGLGTSVLTIVTIVFYCVWAFGANKNARALGADGMTHSAGWTVGWFFIPIANLWKPYQAIKEVAEASDPTRGPGDWKGVGVPAIFGWWWAAWIVNNIVSNATLRMAFNNDPTVVASSAYLSLVALPIAAAATWLAIRVIQHIERCQREKAEQLFGADRLDGSPY